MKLSIIRNAVFAVTGIGVIYLPVTLFSKTKPKVGLLMIPKTCAYMWIIAMGLQLLF